MNILSIIKKSSLVFSLTLSFSLAGCSGDDEGGELGGGKASPYWTLESGNANMPSSGTIIAQYSDAPAGSEIGKLVDNDAATKYVTSHSAFEIKWNGNNNVAALAYSLTSATDSPEMDPKSWTLSGSLDNRVWKELDVQENQTFAGRGEVKSYELDNGVAYRYYRLSIESNNGGADTQIAEWVLSAAIFTGNIDDLMQFSSGNTYTAVTPMGTQHLGDRTATAADLAWLKDTAEEPETFANLSWATFPVGSLYPYGNPTPADVNQHLIGDCCACSVMASMAYLYPRFIKSIIKENGDQTFTVTLYDPKGEPVEVGVSSYFVADGTKVGGTSGKGDKPSWATVLEKAMIKWHQIYRGTSDVGGIGTEYVSAIFVGDGGSFAFDRGKLSAKDLQRAAMVSLEQRNIVIGGFSPADKPVDGKYLTVGAHAYAFMPAVNDQYLFTMRNPWGMLPLVNGGGYSDGKDDGLMNIAGDKVVPPTIDLRICNPGAAKGYANAGNLELYTPPMFAPAPMRVAAHILHPVHP